MILFPLSVRCTVHPHVPSQALRLFPTGHLLQPPPPQPFPTTPCINWINTPLEPGADTWLDEGLMEPDVKGETQAAFLRFTVKFPI